MSFPPSVCWSRLEGLFVESVAAVRGVVCGQLEKLDPLWLLVLASIVVAVTELYACVVELEEGVVGFILVSDDGDAGIVWMTVLDLVPSGAILTRYTLMGPPGFSFEYSRKVLFPLLFEFALS